jgi:hypothetical protein
MNSNLRHAELAGEVSRAMFSRRGLLKRNSKGGGGSGPEEEEDEDERIGWTAIIFVIIVLSLIVCIMLACMKLCVSFFLPYELHGAIH